MKKSYSLEIVVFFAGFIVLTFEVVGARLLGPHYGTSTFVWSSIIGVILASLSLGYYLGGKIADRGSSRTGLSDFLFYAGIVATLTLLTKDSLLVILHTITRDIRIGSILASLLLFAPTSILLGIISPYAVRLALTDLKESGSRIGNLSAISTAGSILGTFATGFWLLPFFGVNTLLTMVPIALILLSILLTPRHRILVKSLFLVFFLLILIVPRISKTHANATEYDTLYSHIRIVDHTRPGTKERLRMMQINIENHSSMSLDSDRLVNRYTEFYHLARHFVPHFSRGLMFGGAGYSFPKDYLKTYPSATLDVVEIDPGVTELAKKYFGLEENPRLRIHHEDARVFLNQNTEKYDVIFGDAFTSWYSVPYQLTTIEAVKRQYDTLTDSGAVILNIISSIDGDTGEFLRAEYHTFKSIFPQVYLFPVSLEDPTQPQNIILVALKSPVAPRWETTDSQMEEFLGRRYTGVVSDDMPTLTDDYAPVDHYVGKLMDKMN